MTAQEHFELSQALNEQAREVLKRFGVTKDMKDFEEYSSLGKLANKHFGIYLAVQTRKHRAWCREHGMKAAY